MRILALVVIALILLVPIVSFSTTPKYLHLRNSGPTPSPTSTPPASLTGSYDFVGSNDAGKNCPSTLPANANGCAINVKWARVEPQNGVFDWSFVDAILANYSANAVLQLTISTGEVGTPDSAAVCASLNPPVPACTPWLSGITGVSAHWDKSGSSGLPCNAALLIPNPADTTYQAAYAGLIAGIQAKYGGNAKISFIGISPISFRGSDLSMGISSKPGNICGVNETYNAAWSSLSGCADDTCFSNWTRTAFDTLWYGTGGLATVMTGVNTILASQATLFPSMTGGPGSSNPNISPLLFTDALNHQNSPANLSLFDEAMSSGAFACNTLTGLVNTIPPNPPPTGGFTGQAVSNFSNNCTSVCNTGTKWGAYLCGIAGMQVYSSNFSPCSSSIAKMNQAFSGTPGITCP